MTSAFVDIEWRGQRVRIEHAFVGAPDALVINERDVPVRWMPDTGERWGTTRFVEPDDLRHDAHVNIVTLQPGGVIPWHDHTAIQGMALLVSGEMVELRNSCLDPITYRAGDVAIEDAATAHSWRNESDAVAVVLVSHVVAR